MNGCKPLLCLMGALVLAVTAGILPRPASAEEAAWDALRAGGIVLFRHALAPGGGDPPGFRIGDCATQRNLDDRGRAQAHRIGAAFRARNIEIGGVLSSQWCRSRETADLAFPGLASASPAFNSFFSNRADGPAQTAQAIEILGRWTGPGALVVTTHQVNITALTGGFTTSGEGIVILVENGEVEVIGRIAPPAE